MSRHRGAPRTALYLRLDEPTLAWLIEIATAEGWTHGGQPSPARAALETIARARTAAEATARRRAELRDELARLEEEGS